MPMMIIEVGDLSHKARYTVCNRSLGGANKDLPPFVKGD